MPFVAFLDACVLFPPNRRDVILTIAEAGICQIRWSPDVLDEMSRNIVVRAKVNSSRAQTGAQYVRRAMEGAFPDAMVDYSLYAQLIPMMPNDPKDRHVLAAAIASRADVLVTANIKDFQASPESASIKIQHPDEFLCHQLEHTPSDFFHALADLASKRREPMNSVPSIVRALQKTVPHFSTQASNLFSDFLPSWDGG